MNEAGLQTALEDRDSSRASAHGGDNSAQVLRSESEKNGAGDRDRTGDIQLGKLAFYR
jgi:hypothetical protein